MKSVAVTSAGSSSGMPLTVRPTGTGPDLAQLVAEHRETVAQWLLEHGAVLFRDFAIDSVERFERLAATLSPHRSNYIYRSTPRTAVADRIFTATEYPPDRTIPLHNENAYQRSWPLRIAFCCITPASAGGATSLADMRRVTSELGTALIEEVAGRCIRYVRHYQPYIDLPWQTVFQTTDRNEVARYCRENSIDHQWLDAHTLRTWQVCQGAAQHPLTGETLYFNQAHLFHVSSLEPDELRMLTTTVGADLLPRNAFFGNGDSIEDGVLDAVRTRLRENSVLHQWKSGDVLLLDNMRVAHGRQPFKGARRLLAVLLDQYAPPTA
jgi:alpha-ketoglutarate-dependent taurine dioxygenase